MIFKKDNFYWGLVLGTLAPILGMFLFKYVKFKVFSFNEVVQFMLLEPGYRTLSVGLSLSLLMNAALFTVYINSGRDQTAKGIFVTTLLYGAVILSIKTFY